MVSRESKAGQTMDFEFSERTQRYTARVKAFMAEHVYPAEKMFERQLNEAPTRWQIPPIMEELKAKARAQELWNLFLPESDLGAGLTNLEYAPLCEIMGDQPDRAGGVVQLLSARYRQHGDARSLRHAGAAGSGG